MGSKLPNVYLCRILLAFTCCATPILMPTTYHANIPSHAADVHDVDFSSSEPQILTLFDWIPHSSSQVDVIIAAIMSLRENLYTHEPLPNDRSIRLVQLVPDPTEPHGFSLTLQTVNLDDNPVFCALSYTKHSAIVSKILNQGDYDKPPAGVYVACDGRKLAVSENALDFLCQMFRDRLFLSTMSEVNSESVRLGSLTSAQTEDGKVIPLKQIWIDGISTNQKDAAERSSQVLLRGDIFQQCKLTIAWLGKAEPHPGVLWVTHTFIPRYLALGQKKGGSFLQCRDSACTDPEIIEHLGTNVCSRWRQESTHFCLFLVQRRWFIDGRSVQDIVSNSLGKAKVAVMLSGSSAMAWASFNSFMFSLSPTGWRKSLTDGLCLEPLGLDPRDTILYRAAVSSILLKLHVIPSIQSRIREASGDDMKAEDTGLGSRYGPMTDAERAHVLVFEVLCLMRGRHFLDSRDAIYASYSLASQAIPSKIDAGTPMHHVYNLTVNYQLPVAHVYTQAAWSIIKNTPYLTLPGTVGRADRKRHHGLPSWVPDFSVPIGTTRLTPQPAGTQRANFNASNTRSPTAAFRLLPGNALQLRGIKISAVSQVASKLQGSNQLDFGWFLKLLLQYHNDETIANPYSNQPPGAEKLPSISPTEALTRVLFIDGFPVSIPASDLPQAVRKWWAHHIIQQARNLSKSQQGAGAALRALASQFASVANPTNANAPTPSDLETEAWFPSLTELRDMILAKITPITQQSHEDNIVIAALDRLISRMWGSQGISFFRSMDGRFGLGTSAIQPGDEVWLLEGGQTPFILRRDPARTFEMSVTTSSSIATEKDHFISFFSSLLSGDGSGSRARSGYRVLGETYVHGVMYGELADTVLLRRMGPVVLV